MRRLLAIAYLGLFLSAPFILFPLILSGKTQLSVTAYIFVSGRQGVFSEGSEGSRFVAFRSDIKRAGYVCEKQLKPHELSCQKDGLPESTLTVSSGLGGVSLVKIRREWSDVLMRSQNVPSDFGEDARAIVGFLEQEDILGVLIRYERGAFEILDPRNGPLSL